jgi:hypothetical protein
MASPVALNLLRTPVFAAHVELLQFFLDHRPEIVESIQELLNAQKQPSHYFQDGPLLARHFEECFFALAAITPDQLRMRDELEEVHWACGFKPSEVRGNDLIDAAEMMMRGYYFWQRTRWPGRNGRIRYAHTLFNLYVLRCLELLSMRLWDTESSAAGDRLAQVQTLLDALWRTSPTDQPVLVRKAGWLIPLAQSPTTDELAAYFEVAEQVAESLAAEDRLEIHRAGVLMAGGHLRSQLRHYCIKNGVSLAENSLVLSSRNTNALDFAITIQSLVPLLEAYERAIAAGDQRDRLEWADAICQGISADPELFVNRVDLLGAYSMIEHLFIATDAEGHAVYTPMGGRHVQLLRDYIARITRMRSALYDDLPHFKPIAGTHSPYALIYGFSSNLTEHIALKTLQAEAITRFSLEDVFTGEEGGDKLAWVSGWRKLPHIKPEVQKRFEYPQQFAEDIFERIKNALHQGAASGENRNAVKTGRLLIEASSIPALPARYIGSSDPQIVSAGTAHSYEEARLLHDRKEGMFLVSYRTAGGWVALTKDILTEVLGMGRDARVIGLPDSAAEILRLMCPNIAIESA